MIPPEYFLIGADAGANPRMSALLAMLRYARHVTLNTARELTTAQLDFEYAGGTSIGALLQHIAAVESWFQVETFEQRELTPEETEYFRIGLNLGAEANRHARGRTLADHTGLLIDIRARTEQALRQRDDAWLAEMVPFEGRVADNYWKWFHVCEEDIHHRGQIGWLRARVIALA